MVRSQGVPRRLSPDAARKRFSLRVVAETVAELRRVTWPTRDETLRLTLMVLAVSAVIGAFLGVVDIAFARIVERVLG
jgi:preprotein translocase SecE subunit